MRGTHVIIALFVEIVVARARVRFATRNDYEDANFPQYTIAQNNEKQSFNNNTSHSP